MSQRERFAVGYLLICWMVFCAYKLVQEFIKDFKGEELKLNTSYPKFFQEILHFATPMFHEYNIKYYPEIFVSYYKHKKWLGSYTSGKRKITIYVNAHTEGNETKRILEMFDSMLHELKHHFDDLTNPDYKNYNRYLKTTGYKNSPLEIAAREFAKENTPACIKHLKQKGIIS
jgi:hypothetical protein